MSIRNIVWFCSQSVILLLVTCFFLMYLLNCQQCHKTCCFNFIQLARQNSSTFIISCVIMNDEHIATHLLFFFIRTCFYMRLLSHQGYIVAEMRSDFSCHEHIICLFSSFLFLGIFKFYDISDVKQRCIYVVFWCLCFIRNGSGTALFFLDTWISVDKNNKKRIITSKPFRIWN